MEDRVIEKVEEKIQHILDEDINTNNLDHLFKLSKIKHLAKEDKEMYGEYGRSGYGRGEYGEYGNYSDGYGRRRRYRGEDEIDRMAGEYGRYQESRSRYGHGEETDKSFHYMVKSLEDFLKVLHEEASTPQQNQMLNETLQRSIR